MNPFLMAEGDQGENCNRAPASWVPTEVVSGIAIPLRYMELVV
jgi:hypothetical protein